MGIQALRERKDELAKQGQQHDRQCRRQGVVEEEAAAYDQMTARSAASMRRSRQSPSRQTSTPKNDRQAAKNSKENDRFYDAVACTMKEA